MAKHSPMKFKDNPMFRRKTAHARLFGPEAGPLPALPPASLPEPWNFTRPHGLSYVMSKDEERQRFLQYNYAKFLYTKMVKDNAKEKGTWYGGTLRNWLRKIRHLEEYLTRLNMPLLFSMTVRNRYRFGMIDWNEAISDGQPGLLRAVRGYDVEKRVKFSTYCCRCIIHALTVSNAKQGKQRSRFPVVEAPEVFEGAGEPAAPEAQEASELVSTLLKVLDENAADLNEEQELVLTKRFGLEGRPPETLEVVGDRLGVSKERVRQIQNKALEKVKKALVRTGAV